MGGHRSRRLSTRLWRLLAVTGIASAAYCRWCVMPHHVTVVDAPREAAFISRKQVWERIDASWLSNDDVYDVCVIGGGAVGLYTAIDAAQRGLRVALLEACDFGSSRSPSRLGFLPGGFAFFQRALKQREPSAAREACLAMLDITTWENVLGSDAVRRVVTWHPSQHGTETLELTLTAFLSTCVAMLLGPVPRTVGRSLRSPDIDALRQRSVACEDAVIDYPKAILSMVHTLRRLGGAALNYAEVVRVAREPLQFVGSSNRPETTCYDIEVVDRSAVTSTDAAALRKHRLRSLTVVNCTGASVDRVRHCIPRDAADPRDEHEAPNVVERHSAFSYFVVPEDELVEAKSREPLFAVSSQPWALLSNSVLSHSSSVSITPFLGMDRCVFVGAVVSPVAANDPTTVTPQHVDAALPGSAVPGSLRSIRNQLNMLGVDLLSGRVASRVVCDVPTLSWPSQLAGGQRAASLVLNHGFCVLPLDSVPGGGTATSGHLDILGGSIASSRRAGEEAVDRVVSHLVALGRLSTRLPCHTRTLSLRLPGQELALASNGVTDTRNFVAHCIEHLYAQSVEDILLRRTNAALADPLAAAEAVPAVAKLMAEKLEWTSERTRKEVAAALRSIECMTATA